MCPFLSFFSLLPWTYARSLAVHPMSSRRARPLSVMGGLPARARRCGRGQRSQQGHEMQGQRPMQTRAPCQLRQGRPGHSHEARRWTHLPKSHWPRPMWPASAGVSAGSETDSGARSSTPTMHWHRCQSIRRCPLQRHEVLEERRRCRLGRPFGGDWRGRWGGGRPLRLETEQLGDDRRLS